MDTDLNSGVSTGSDEEEGQMMGFGYRCQWTARE